MSPAALAVMMTRKTWAASAINRTDLAVIATAVATAKAVTSLHTWQIFLFHPTVVLPTKQQDLPRIAAA